MIGMKKALGPGGAGCAGGRVVFPYRASSISQPVRGDPGRGILCRLSFLGHQRGGDQRRCAGEFHAGPMFVSGHDGVRDGRRADKFCAGAMSCRSCPGARAMLPFAFVTILWFLLRCRNLRRGWFYALLAFLGFGIGVTTWTVRNIEVLHEPLPIVEAVQYHLLVGNNPQATGGPLSPYHTISDVIKEPLPESSEERSKLFGRQARDYMSNHLAETCRCRLQAGCYFFLGQDFFSKGELAEQQPGADEAQKEATKWLRESAPTLLAGSLLAMLLALGWAGPTAGGIQGFPLLWPRCGSHCPIYSVMPSCWLVHACPSMAYC